MTGSDIEMPKKQREFKAEFMDSRRWNGFQMRDDDIVIATWGKTGTTWMQQIVGQLVFEGEAGLYGVSRSPWLEFVLDDGATERAAAQTHRRYLKTHLPINALHYSPNAKYLYVARDGRDVFWSLYNHHNNYHPEILDLLTRLNPDGPPYTYLDADIRVAFLSWLENDNYGDMPFFPHVQGWFDQRHLPNLRLIHFTDLKADLPGQIRTIADFLGIGIDPTTFSAIVGHCSFDYMRALAVQDLGVGELLKGGGATFINKGTNGRWRDVLSEEDNARYQAAVARRLSPEAALWLETGRLPK